VVSPGGKTPSASSFKRERAPGVFFSRGGGVSLKILLGPYEAPHVAKKALLKGVVCGISAQGELVPKKPVLVRKLG